MKKSLVLLVLVLALVALVPIAGYASIYWLNVPTAIGGVVGWSLLLLAFSDYARRPRFRLRSSRTPTALRPIIAAAQNASGACDWTYATRSA